MTVSETETYVFLLGFNVPVTLSYCPFTEMQRDKKKRRLWHSGKCEERDMTNYKRTGTEIQTGAKILRSQRHKDTKITRKTLAESQSKNQPRMEKVETRKYTDNLICRHR